IALGLAQPTLSKESMFDQRLFNQSAGLSSGFGADDSYDLYDKPLFQGSASAAVYRPSRGKPDESLGGMAADRVERLLGEGGGPHRGFQGAEGGPGGARDGPVQFEEEAGDVFGFAEFMGAAKKGRGDGKDGERGRRKGEDQERGEGSKKQRRD
ncbi:hypothetical protein BDK51DRAFT_30658, partial [Blyttiomyces helicus]